MHIHTSQLIEGCMITKDVTGKTNHPIVEKNTVVKPIHIEILHDFMIDEVEVGPKLANGSTFKPKESKEEPSIVEESLDERRGASPFVDHYLEGVAAYKRMYQNWKSGADVDIASVRETFLPLFKRASRHANDVITLHHYSSKSDYIYHHSVAVGLLSFLIASKLQFNEREQLQVGISGLLSDCGMAKIDERILSKSGPLTEAEYTEIKQHPSYSYKMLERVSSVSQSVRFGALQHHERMDGSGYPLGVHDNKLHPYGKIIAVSDMYHAMTCERLYKTKQSPFRVIEAIMKDQFGKFDPHVVQVFVKQITNFSAGTKVRLSNNQHGEIIFIEDQLPTRPMIRLSHSDQIIHLKDYPQTYIEEVL
ncbi:phosphohydrolase [Pontibacillus halophilus JSM 076056 = DSM 19796]|uniref:Phosphohydrolase n=1 Tax=Pontibacillus halophilus JSM 076056 = DSM 19796 TaxID=1385510 RepID=A0A0A5GK57_9BACI|nr:HD-GYP domain-containing protein [Pontibacillus halophilus]KGX93666.1 phosphohydrolase [Pontibacillus halophilus JSM 076056 = DSM 19796]